MMVWSFSPSQTGIYSTGAPDVNQNYPVTVVDIETGQPHVLEPNGPWWAVADDSGLLSPSIVVLDRETGECIRVNQCVAEILFFAEYGMPLFLPAPDEDGI